MGLASKVQGAQRPPGGPPPTSASAQSTSYPQINQQSFQGAPNGVAQRPQLPGTSGPMPIGPPGGSFPQNFGARPPQQQQAQRPMLQQAPSFQHSPSFQLQAPPGSQGFGQPGMSQGYGQPARPQGFGPSPSFNQGYSQPQLMPPPAQPSQPTGNQFAPQLGASNIQPGLQPKLEGMIRTNRLEAFYPAQKLQSVLQRLSNIDFRQLAQRWNMPLELAYDLATLALYDIVIYADDSGSMIFEEGGERIQDLKLILAKVAEVATLFDDDGIVVRFMNSQTQGNGIRNATEANNLISQVNFTGMTPLGSRLEERVIRPFLAAGVQNRNLEKPILVITITDGEPVGEPQNTVSHVIKNAKTMVSNSVYGPGAIAFEFAQVGKDTKAQAFLGRLDNDPDIGGMIDATSYFELEAEEYLRRGVNLTPELWLVKLMVGAVDPTYDEQDA